MSTLFSCLNFFLYIFAILTFCMSTFFSGLHPFFHAYVFHPYSFFSSQLFLSILTLSFLSKLFFSIPTLVFIETLFDVLATYTFFMFQNTRIPRTNFNRTNSAHNFLQCLLSRKRLKNLGK